MQLGLTGWVRNLFDGRVEAVFEGDESGLQAVLDWCRTGPPRSRPAGIETEWSDATGEFGSFEVRY